MKIEPQNDASMKHLAELIGKQRVTMMTFYESGEGLSSRPMTPIVMDGSGAIWFITSHKTVGARFEQGPAKVNLSFAQESDANYVSLAGRAELIDDTARKHELWSAASRPWFDGPDDPDLVLLKVVPEHAEIWDGPDSNAVRALAMAASVAAGKPIGLGHQENIKPAR